jgi:hypothetical protein
LDIDASLRSPAVVAGNGFDITTSLVGTFSVVIPLAEGAKRSEWFAMDSSKAAEDGRGD